MVCVHVHIAQPLRLRGVSPFLILFAVFFASGVFHEYFALGAAGSEAILGPMTLFFMLQAVGIAITDRWRIALPAFVAQPLTFLWMASLAPAFFLPLKSVLLDIDYPAAWLCF